MEHLRIGSNLKGVEFIAPVVDNNDPLRIQRVRVRIPILHNGVQDSQLPWVAPQDMNGVGHGGGASSQFVPVVGSLVKVIFKNGNPHMPEYTAKVLVPGNVSPVLAVNYPNRWGIVDPKGNQFWVDMQAGDAEFLHHSGTLVHINNDGSATLKFVGDITSSAPLWTHTGDFILQGNMTIEQNLTVVGNADVQGTMTVT